MLTNGFSVFRQSKFTLTRLREREQTEVVGVVMEHSDRAKEREWSLIDSDARDEAKSLLEEEPSFLSSESPFPATNVFFFSLLCFHHVAVTLLVLYR